LNLSKDFSIWHVNQKKPYPHNIMKDKPIIEIALDYIGVILFVIGEISLTVAAIITYRLAKLQ